MKDLHDILLPVNENKYFSTPDIPLHLVGYNPTQGIKTLAHVNRIRIQVIGQGLMQMEHAD